MIQAYPYQLSSVEKAKLALQKTGKVLIVMATGLGKTLVGALTIEDLLRVGKGLLLCHTNVILEQDLEVFREVFGNRVRLGIFNGEKKHWEETDILFASFQTFSDWKNVFFENEFLFIIVDESHHSQANSFKSVLDYFNPSYLIGLTATPDRMDQKNIRDIFGDEVVNITFEEAIVQGWLANVEYHLVTDNLSSYKLRKIADDVMMKGKKITLKQLNDSIFITSRDEMAAQKILEYGDKKMIIFCENIQHVLNFSRFIPDSLVWHSRLSKKKSDETLHLFRTNLCKRLLVVNKANEGIDIPDAEVLVFLRCTDSKNIYLQQLGRGLRKTESKDKVIVLDFVANADRIIMIQKIVRKIEDISSDLSQKERNIHKRSLYFSGEHFEFIFSQAQINLFAILEKLQFTYISDVPELFLEYSEKNILPSDKVIAGTDTKLWWKCSKCDHEWQAIGGNRFRLGQGCPACSGRVSTKDNNLLVTHPQLGEEYSNRNTIPPDQILAGTGKKVWWKCSKCDHEWQATGYSRVVGTGCPACAGKIATKEKNLAVTHPFLAEEYSTKNTVPTNQILAGSHLKVWWKCIRCDFEWQTTVVRRSRRGHGCPACAGSVPSERNNLTVSHPELALEYSEKNKLSATQVLAGTHQLLWWKCIECGSEWQARGKERVNGEKKCPNRKNHPK